MEKGMIVILGLEAVLLGLCRRGLWQVCYKGISHGGFIKMDSEEFVGSTVKGGVFIRVD